MVNTTIIWICLFLFFFVLEILTISLVSVWFCLGSGIAIILSAMDAPVYIQIIVFLIVSLTTLLAFYPMRNKILKTQKTNLDSLIGETCIVAETIHNLKYQGKVLIKGQVWSALSADDSIIEPGETCIVKEFRGARVIVERREAC